MTKIAFRLYTRIFSLKGSTLERRDLFCYWSPGVIDPPKAGSVSKQRAVVGGTDLGLRQRRVRNNEKCSGKIQRILDRRAGHIEAGLVKSHDRGVLREAGFLGEISHHVFSLSAEFWCPHLFHHDTRDGDQWHLSLFVKDAHRIAAG